MRQSFQSTCPARGTTAYYANYKCTLCNFNPRAPRGARLSCRYYAAVSFLISIHVPREGHDNNSQIGIPWLSDFNPRAPRGARHYILRRIKQNFLFQSTCPARGTTVLMMFICVSPFISIHVPREGHDGHQPGGPDGSTENFNPRAPRGARPPSAFWLTWLALFQSTCPARGTTPTSKTLKTRPSNFNPRAPRGARRRARKRLA